MSPEFAAAVDPIFTYVLSVMDKIESGQTPLAEDVSQRVRSHVDQAEHRLGNRDDWELAKYALLAWVDDVMLDAPWEGRTWWERNRLEFRFFRTAEAFSLFYRRANEATKIANKDALEVFYVCVILGFRGLYDDPAAVEQASEFGVPPTLEEWARRTSMSIQLGQGRTRLKEEGQPGSGAEPLEAKYLFVFSLLMFVVLLAVALLVGWFLFWS